MKPRYVLHPAPVVSKTDGDRHNITARQLAHLYGVRMADCVVYHAGMRLDEPNDIHLYPRYDGNYRLPGIALQPITDRKVI